MNGWLEFIQEPSFISSAWLKNRKISKAMDRLKYLSADEEIRAIADLRQRNLNDRISERNTAVAEVREKAKAEKELLVEKAIKNLLTAGVNSEVIAKSLNLSIKEISELENPVTYSYEI